MSLDSRVGADPVEASNEFYERLAALLRSPAVQSINFKLGHVVVTPHIFSTVADALQACRLKIYLEPEYLKSKGASAAYSLYVNAFRFKSERVLDTAVGRGYAVHEAVHAGLDADAKQTAALHDEGAAFIAEFWYRIKTTGVGSSKKDESDLTKIASELLAKSDARKGQRAVASASQINAARAAARSMGYPAMHYRYNGY